MRVVWDRVHGGLALWQYEKSAWNVTCEYMKTVMLVCNALFAVTNKDSVEAQHMKNPTFTLHCPFRKI
jgi:hypothetical protein